MRSPLHWLLVVGIAATVLSTTLMLNGQYELAFLVAGVALTAYAGIRLLDWSRRYAPARRVA